MEQGVIIVAGGSGTRMGAALPKQFLLLDGQPVLARTINRFAEALPDAAIVVVLPAAHLDFWNDFAARFTVARHTTVAGGAERSDSVRNGLAALPEEVRIIAVQDGVRPLVSPELIRRAAACAERHGTAIPVIAPVDSLRRITETGSAPADRSQLRIVQTPQVFDAALLRRAYAAAEGMRFTDDAQVVEHLGVAITLCEGERANIKITAPEDLIVAEAILEARREEPEENRRPEDGAGEETREERR